MELQIGKPEQLVWMWLVLIIALVASFGLNWRRRAIRNFATTDLLPQLFPANLLRRQVARTLVSLAAMALLVLGLADIRWGKTWQEVPQKGIEVVFALDVSRSMLADDVAPNRLERAKQQIVDLVDAMAGDRVGLVVFAGESRRVIPLTRHYQDFKNALIEVGPYDVDRGGSQLAQAIKTAADSFLDKTGDHRAIVIFSDGEDLGSDPVDVARDVYNQQGIRIITVGLGDPVDGALVPAPPNRQGQKYTQYQGQPVRSRLNSQVLQQVALETGGAYVPVETKNVDMADVYDAYIATLQQRDFELARINQYIPRYPIFVGVALGLMLAELFWPQRRKPRRPSRRTIRFRRITDVAQTTRQPRATSPAAARLRPSTLLVMFALLIGAAIATPALGDDNANQRLNQAVQQLVDGQVDAAVETLKQLNADHPADPRIAYNLGVALYRQQQFDDAQTHFRQAVNAQDPALAARASFNLGNCDYAQALNMSQQNPQNTQPAIQRLRAAIKHYRNTLAWTDDRDARINLELARRLLKQLEQQAEQQRNQKQQNQQQQPEQDPQDESRDQRGDAQGQQNQPQDPSDESQKSPGELTQPPSESRSDPDSSDPGSDSKPQQPPTKQDSNDLADENMQPNPEDDAPKEQPEPTNSDQQAQPNAIPSPNQPSPQPRDSQNRQAAGTGPPNAASDSSARARGAIDPQEALKMLQAIRDRELMRRLKLLDARRRRRIPVDRDW